VFDVRWACRPNSETSANGWRTLSAENKKQFYIPQGFAHGFLVLTEERIYLQMLRHYDPRPRAA
jgi:dTDP-4-dehydrorhamnose 3,5-epimerase